MWVPTNLCDSLVSQMDSGVVKLAHSRIWRGSLVENKVVTCKVNCMWVAIDQRDSVVTKWKGALLVSEGT